MLQSRIAQGLVLSRPALKAVKPISLISARSLVLNSLVKPQTFMRPTSIDFSNKVHRLYSTKTAPPPPPPPPSEPSDKNAKGKLILNRISRFFTFSLSSVLVLGAFGVSLLVIYLILSELFLPSGDTKTFNKAVKLLEQNELAQKALDFKSGERVKAYGEVPGDRWVRNRPVQSVRSKGKDGNDRLYMKFHVETDSGKHGSVTLEQVDTSFWSSEFSYIALDIPRQRRIYIIEPKYQGLLHNEHGNNGFLGLKWGPRKDN